MTFKEWCIQNGKTCLLEEWDSERNSKTPDEYSWCSGLRVHWICKLHHAWTTTIAHRVTEGTGCPVCNNKKIQAGYNDFETWCHKNNRCDLLEEWDYKKNDAFGVTPKNISKGSSKKVWWRCKQEHEWQAVVYSRTAKVATNCPVCSQKMVFAGYNDLETKCKERGNVDLLDEWNYEKNGLLTPKDVTAHSDKKVWWKCKQGHEWRSVISARFRGNGCPKCNSHGTSFPEQAILYYIKKCFPDTKHRYAGLGFECDIYIPSIKTAIEYDSVLFHKNRGKSEVAKNKKCEENNIKLIRIREAGLCFYNNCMCIERKDVDTLGSLDSCIKLLFEYLNLPYCNIDTRRDSVVIAEQYKYLELQNSFAQKYPKLAEEWHPSKNGCLQPEHVKPGSHQNVWWLCENGHEWQAVVKSRSRGSGCPECGRKRTLTAKSHRVICVETGIVYSSLTDAERQTNIERHGIAACCKGKRQTWGGFHWEYQ